MKIKLLILCLIINLGSCALTESRPKLEMSFARAAFYAAKEIKANEHSSTTYRKAEIYFFKAKSAYKRKYFNKARDYAILTRKFAEQAEYSTRLKLSQSNDEE
jgi:hypothetical protein